MLRPLAFALVWLVSWPGVAADMAPPVSVISLPLNFSIAALKQQLDKAIPNPLAVKDDWGSNNTKYRVNRGSIRMAMRGEMLETIIPISLSMEHNLKIGLFEQAVGCKDISLNLIFTTEFSIDRNWRLISRTSTGPRRYSRRCVVSAAKVDATHFVDAAIARQQQKTAAQINDRTTTAFDFRSIAETVWQTLARPIAIDKAAWLLIQPEELGISKVIGKGDDITVYAGLKANPRLLITQSPTDSGTVPKPLPPPIRFPGPQAKSFHVSFTVELPFVVPPDQALSVGDIEVQVADLRIGTDGSKLNLALTLAQPVDDTFSFTGALQYQGDGRFGIAGLMLDEATHARLKELPGWVGGRELKEYLNSLDWDVSEQIQPLTPVLRKAFELPFAGGRIIGRFQEFTTAAIEPSATGLSIAIIATGDARIEID